MRNYNYVAAGITLMKPIWLKSVVSVEQGLEALLYHKARSCRRTRNDPRLAKQRCYANMSVSLSLATRPVFSKNLYWQRESASV